MTPGMRHRSESFNSAPPPAHQVARSCREFRREAEVPAAQKRPLHARACAAAAPHPSRSVELEHAARGPVVQRHCSRPRHESADQSALQVDSAQDSFKHNCNLSYLFY